MKPEIGDEDSASLKTYLDASKMYDWNNNYIFFNFFTHHIEKKGFYFSFFF